MFTKRGYFYLLNCSKEFSTTFWCISKGNHDLALMGKRVEFDYNNDSHRLGVTKLEWKGQHLAL